LPKVQRHNSKGVDKNMSAGQIRRGILAALANKK
jgi:hypothetical protein